MDFMQAPENSQNQVKVPISARIVKSLSDGLDELAEATNRKKSFLIEDAIMRYLEEQAWQISAIKDGIKQADDGVFVPDSEIDSLLKNYGVDTDGD